MKLKFIIFFFVFWQLTDAMAAVSGNGISYGFRWKITETPETQSVNPPLKLLWDKSLVWFEKWNAGGQAESQNRHIAMTSQGFVSVVKRSLYLIEREKGKTLWSLALAGDEINDWAVVDDIFVYTAIDWSNMKTIRSAVDLKRHKQLWIQTSSEKGRINGLETVMILPGNSVLFTTNQDDSQYSGPLDMVNPHTGEIILKQDKNVFPGSLVPYTWLAFDGRFYAFATNPGYAGLNIKPYSIFDATVLEPLHIYGNSIVGNFFIPCVVDKDGMLFVTYGIELQILAFNLTEGKLKWSLQLPTDVWSRRNPIKSLALSRANKCLVATMYPNRFVIVDPDNGSIVKAGEATGYLGWTEHNAMLLSYPYLYTTARRALKSGYSYDLIAINLETDKVEWTFEVEKQNTPYGPAQAEILNFIVSDDKVFVARGDAHLMAFQFQGKSSMFKK